jgi:hypothetical protein
MTSSVDRFFRRIRYGQPIIVVSGLPRSGTSMAMKMLDAGGLAIVTDAVRTADEDNPKGYFELERVKDLDKGKDKSWLVEARGKAIKIISFLLKDLPADLNYKILFMNRHIDEVLASQAKMLARRGETSETDDDKMREVYENHLWKVKYMIEHQPHLEAIYINYRDVLENPRGEAKRIAAFAGLGLDVDKMAGAVDEQLYRNRAKA